MNLRNIAIIAHVDHGKTTIVNTMLTQSGTFRSNQQVSDRMMDSGDLEKERGITILAKATSVKWQDYDINIVDTPGHADFGGEVERILSMVDGVVLLVDSAEGPMPQTKFVLGKALGIGLKPIVVINKVDKPDARIDYVLDSIFDLFVGLDATDEQLDFPVLYASGRNGWAVKEPEDERVDLTPLFETIVAHVKAPNVDSKAPFSMLATILESNKFLGRVLTGKIETGSIKVGEAIKALNMKGEEIERFRVSKILAYKGIQRESLESASAGEIVAISGMSKATVADSLCSLAVTTPIKAQPIDPPTLSMTFSVNDSPLAGKEGDKVTSRMIGDRLKKEAEGNIALLITESDTKDAYEVAGRGELQLGVLIETMRREGFELSVSRPRVLFRNDENGRKLEPIEDVFVDVDEEFSGSVVEKMALRKGELQEMIPSSTGNKMRLVFKAPSRGLIGYHSEFLTDTRGTGLMNRVFSSYGPHRGEIEGRRNGVLISSESGNALAYALSKLADRGTMFVSIGTPIYAGMIVGENAKNNDLEINLTKAKQLTNFRVSGKEEAVLAPVPRKIELEYALSYIQDDELLEVTPKSLRLRKKYLDPNERKRMSRS